MLANFNGERLHKIRKDQNMSQAELANRAETTIRYVRALEKGKKRKPSAELVCKLAIALDIPMETLMQIHPEEHDEFYYERERVRVST